MTFNHAFGYSFLSLLKKEGKEKENEEAKIVIKSHAILLDPSEWFWFEKFKNGIFISRVNNSKGKIYHTVQNKKTIKLGNLTKNIQCCLYSKKESEPIILRYCV